MCGFLGIIDAKSIDSIEQGLNFISHRGPDDSGHITFENVALGHRRLSILDLSPLGHQPMFSKDGRFVIVYNGEVYNHLELRKTLLRDYNFISTSDTETILAGFIKYGKDFSSKLNGIFAFAILDKVKREVFVVRDQYGVKPLYLYCKDDIIYFSSELKGFLNLNIDKTLNLRAISNYLYFLYSPGEDTPFKYVKKVQPGTVLTIPLNKPGSFTREKYYSLPFIGQYSPENEKELKDELINKLTASVERQMLADVPIGFFLSGGLDSSAILAIARKLDRKRKINAYTIDTGGGFDGFEDDLKYAKLVANHLNLNLEILKTEIDIVSEFDKMIYHLDEPQADAAPLNVKAICERARECGDIVLLGGVAGDDIFSGYRRHQALTYEKIFDRVPNFIWRFGNSIIDRLPAHGHIVRRGKKLIGNAHIEKPDRMAKYFGWIDDQFLYKLFKEEHADGLRQRPSHFLLKDALNNIPDEYSELNRMLYLEILYFLTDHNLNYTDKMSMAHGVEVRVPFLDRELVDFSTRIPPQLKMRNGETKYLLKKAMETYLPKQVIYRKKTGFGAPVRRWVIKDLDNMINERLSKTNIEKWGIFEPHAINSLILDNKHGKIDASYTIWSLLAIQSWLDQFVENGK